MIADLRAVQTKLRRLRYRLTRAARTETRVAIGEQITRLIGEERSIRATLPPRHQPPVGSAPDAPPPQATQECPRCKRRKHKGRCGGWLVARRENEADLRPVRVRR